MRKIIIENKTGLEINNSYEAEPLEMKLEKMLAQQEPIEGGAPIIFTEKKNGVEPQYDIRTDRWEIAQNAMEVVHKTEAAKRDNLMPKQEVKQEGELKQSTDISNPQ